MILFVVGLQINLINLYFYFAYIIKKFRYTCILSTKFSYTNSIQSIQTSGPFDLITSTQNLKVVRDVSFDFQQRMIRVTRILLRQKQKGICPISQSILYLPDHCKLTSIFNKGIIFIIRCVFNYSYDEPHRLGLWFQGYDEIIPVRPKTLKP